MTDINEMNNIEATPEKKKKVASGAKKTKLTFETALARLEEISAKLEGGSVSLEESMKLYEEGMQLALLCKGELDSAEQKVSVLRQTPSGELAAVPFEVADND